MTRGHEVFAKTIEEMDLLPVFGNPGTTEIPMLRSVKGYVLTLLDSISVGMADGRSQYLGKPSLVNLHTMPGVGHSMGFIHTAKMNRSPVIITSGQQDTRHQFYEPLLSHDLRTLVGSAVKYFYEIRDADDIEPAIKRAARISMEAPRGPVFLSFPMNLMDEDSLYTSIDFSIPGNNQVDMAGAAEVMNEIEMAGNPAIIFGSEVDEYGAIDRAAELVEKLGIPAYGEPLSSRSPYDTSRKGFAGDLLPASTAINVQLLQHDLIVMIGASVTLYPYLPSKLFQGKKVIYAGLNPDNRYGRCYVSNPKLFIEKLLELAKRKGNIGEPASIGIESEAARERRRMGIGYVAYRIRREFQGYTIVDESISNSPAVRRIIGYAGRSYFNAKSGMLGWGVPAAAGIAMENSRVLAIIGDGSLMYTIQSLYTLKRYSIPLKIVVLNNGGYSILKSFSKSFYPEMENAEMFSPATDIEGISKAFGIEARRAGQDLEDLKWLREGIEPKLLVVDMDRTVQKLFP